jgi:hypothetical protein
MRHLAPLQAVLAVVTLAAVVVVVHFSPQASSPTAMLGWGRDAFGMYDRRAPPQVGWMALGDLGSRPREAASHCCALVNAWL